MSEFIAEAQVLIRPNTAAFRTDLEKQLLAATRGINIPIAVTAAGAGLAGASAATAALTNAQRAASASTSELTGLAKIENTTFARQAVDLVAASAATEQLAGAQTLAAGAAKKSTASLLGAGNAAGRLDAGLLGLRTALGSTAVIGLGAAALAAIALGKAFRASVQNFAAFQQELATFQVTAQATAAQMDAVRAQATKLGEDIRLPAVSAADAAIAMTELSKAGLSVQDSLAGAEGVLQLATAAQISNADAAKIAANALNSFGLAGDQATRVADDFANAANAAQGSISDLGLAFQQASAVSRQVGLSLEDTTAILSLFAKNGLQGSDAGTSLRVALIKLVAPTSKAADEIKKLGLNLRDAQGNIRADVFAQFGEATAQLTPKARDAAAALIFGQDAIRAVSIGAREGAEGLRLMQFEIDQTGTAAAVAAARTQGLAGSFSALQSNLQTASIGVGKFISPILKGLADGLSKNIILVTAFANKVDDLKKTFSDADPVAAKAAKGVGAFAGQLLKVGLEGIPVALADQFGVFDENITESQKKVKALNVELQGLEKARIAAERGGRSDVADQLTNQIKAVRNEINSLKADAGGINSAVAEPLRNAVTLLTSVRDALPKGDPGIPALNAQIRSLNTSIQDYVRAAKLGVDGSDRVSSGFEEVRDGALQAAGAVNGLIQQMKNLQRQSSTLADQLQKAQAEGATPQTQIGLLQQANANARARIAAAEAGGRTGGDIITIRKARAEIISNNAEIKSLNSGIVADQKKAAADAKDAATKAQKARDEQFQHLADIFGARQQNIADALSRAGIKGNLSAEIRLNKALIVALRNELKALRERLKTLKVSAAERKSILQAINRAIESAQQEQLRLTTERTKNRQDRQQQQRDDRLAHLEAVLAIAETTAGKKDDARALKAIIDFDNARIHALKKKSKLTREEKIELDNLRVDVAQRNKALKDLTGETKKGSSAFFTFLQTQQGFAANLLGNLIPGFATKGLVGGSQAAAAGDTGLRQVAGGFEQPRGAVQGQAAIASSRDRGVRPVQVDTTNQLLRAILRSLQNLNGRTQHPEARHNRAVGSAILDTMGGVHGA